MQKADRDNRFSRGAFPGWWRLTLRVASCTLSQLCVPRNFVLRSVDGSERCFRIRRQEQRKNSRPALCRSSRHLATRQLSHPRIGRRFLQGRLWIRRQLDPRLGRDSRIGHATGPRPEHGVHGRVPRRADAGDDRRRGRSAHAQALCARSARCREEGGNLSRRNRHWRPGVFRRGGRVLHF